MDDTPATGATEQSPPVIIERSDGAQPSYLSRKLGRDFGQPNGAWTPDRAQATRMTVDQAKDAIAAMSEPEALACKAVTA